MAIQILPRGPRASESIGSALSQALGSIAGGLEQRAFRQQETEQAQQQQQQMGTVLQSLGLSPQIATLPKEIQRTIVSSQLKAQQPSLAGVLGRALGIDTRPRTPTMMQQDMPQSALEVAQQEQQLPERVEGEGIAQKIGPLLSGAATQAAGMPGSLLAGGTGLANLLGNLVGFGDVTPSFEQLQERIPTAFGSPEQRAQLEQAIPGLARLYRQQPDVKAAAEFEAPLKPLPTPEQIREKIVEPVAKATGLENIFVPQSQNAKWWQDVGEDVALLFQPGSGFKGAAKKLGLATTGNMLSWIAKDISGNEALGEGLKLGTYLLSSLNPGRISKEMSKDYAAWEDALGKAENTKVDFRPIREDFKKLDNVAQRGAFRSAPKKFLQERMEEFESLVDPVTHKLDIKSVHALKRDHNKLFDQARKLKISKEFGDIIKLEKQMVNKWGKANIPKAAEALRKADSIYSTLAQSGGIRNSINDMLSSRNLRTSGIGYLLGVPRRALLPGMAGAQLAKKASVLMKNPDIRNLVGKIIQDAAKQNIKTGAASLAKLEKKVKKIDPSFLN